MARNSVTIKIGGDDSEFKKVLKGIGKTASATLSTIKGFATIGTTVATAISAAGIASVKYNADIEQLQTSFEVMTGSAEKAANVVERIRRMGAETPFETADLAQTTQMLMQYGLNADAALESMSMLGDVSQGSADKMNRIAMAYGQMHSAGKVQLQDIKQMLEAGFNPLMEISEQTGESMESLYTRISKGTLTVDEITRAMQSATSEGGRFFQSMEKQSQTINGQLSTIKDNVQSLGGTVFEGLSEQLRTDVFPSVNSLLERLQTAYEKSGPDGLVQEFSRQLPRLVTAGANGATQIMTAVTKKMPMLVRNLLNSLPALIRSASTLAPMLAQSIFDVGSAAVQQVIELMPQWAPALLEGAAKLGLEVAKGLFKNTAKTLSALTDLVTTDAEEVWAGLYDQEKVAQFTAKVTGDVDISGAKSSIETAYEELRNALNSDLLSEPQVTAITELIGTDYDTIYAKLKSFGLSDTDAGALATKVTAAGEKVIAEINKLNIGVDGGTVARWIAQAEGSSIRLKSALKRSGLTPTEQDEVAKVFTDMSDNINGKLPDVIGEIYDTLTDGKIENDDKKSLKQLLDEAFKADVEAVDQWLEENIGELDTESSTYAADVAALTQEAAAYKGEITTIHNQMVALVETLAGQPTEVVNARMEEIAAMQARVAEINEYITQTSEAAQNMFAQAFERVRAGATTSETDVADALSYAYTNYKIDQQAITDAAKAAKAEADAAWESGLQTEEDRAAHLETLERIEQDRISELQALQQSYASQLSELMQGLGEAFAVTEPETMQQIASIAEKLNFAEQLNEALEAMQTDDDALVASAKQRIANLMEQLTGEALTPGEINYGKAESFITELENTITEDLKNLEFAEGENPVVTAFESMFQSDAFADSQLDTASISEKIVAIMQGVGTDASAGIGAGAITYSFSGDTDTIASNFEADASASFGRNSPARKMYPLGEDVAAGIGEGAKQYSFAEAGSTVASNAETAISGNLKTAGSNAGKQFSAGLASGIGSGRSKVISAAISVAKAAINAANAQLEINSPSKVMMRTGSGFVEGLTMGIDRSAHNAIDAAKRVTSQMVTAADIPRLNMISEMPTLTQDISYAIEASQQPVNLYVNGKELGRVMAQDNQLAQNRYNRSVALGVGK